MAETGVRQKILWDATRWMCFCFEEVDVFMDFFFAHEAKGE
jgi:hypothetical protein